MSNLLQYHSQSLISTVLLKLLLKHACPHKRPHTQLHPCVWHDHNTTLSFKHNSFVRRQPPPCLPPCLTPFCSINVGSPLKQEVSLFSWQHIICGCFISAPSTTLVSFRNESGPPSLRKFQQAARKLSRGALCIKIGYVDMDTLCLCKPERSK